MIPLKVFKAFKLKKRSITIVKLPSENQFVRQFVTSDFNHLQSQFSYNSQKKVLLESKILLYWI